MGLAHAYPSALQHISSGACVRCPFCSSAVPPDCAYQFSCLPSHLHQVHQCRLLRRDIRIVYVESIARVASLSLSGKILYHARMADAFFVQWPDLQRRFPRSRYKGRLF